MGYSERYYKRDIGILKSYADESYKLTLMKTLKTKGQEKPKGKVPIVRGINQEKLSENISRARSKIFEYALCNDWDYFATFTVDPQKYNRNDLDRYHKSFSQYIRNFNRENGTAIKYLLIPEKHQKGGWHEHGIILGLPASVLRLFTLEEKLPKYIREKIKAGEKVYEWIEYRERFGFCDIEPVRSKEGVSKYITKYISKELERSVTAIGAHLYYCSNGLETATEIKRGHICQEMQPSYENEWIKLQWFSNDRLPDALAMID